MEYLGASGTLIHEKTWSRKSRVRLLLRYNIPKFVTFFKNYPSSYMLHICTSSLTLKQRRVSCYKDRWLIVSWLPAFLRFGGLSKLAGFRWDCLPGSSTTAPAVNHFSISQPFFHCGKCICTFTYLDRIEKWNWHSFCQRYFLLLNL